MAVRACQAIVRDRTWDSVPDVQANIERRLRYALRSDGCTDIRIQAPVHRWIVPDVDDPETDYEPFWAWEIIATGVRDALVSAAPVIINNWRDLEDPPDA